MNKEEQIKRLAQNLHNNGFTKSMDYAIQTAANMLGFPDSMLDKIKESESDGKDNSVNEEEQRSYKDQYTSSDYARKLSQTMAEERVYSSIPGATSGDRGEKKDVVDAQQGMNDMDSGVDVPSPVENKVQNDTVYQQKTMDPVQSNGLASPSDDMFQEGAQNFSRESQNAESGEGQEDESSFLDLSSYDASGDAIRNQDQSPPIEESAFLDELNEEEQTSLISGFISSGEKSASQNENPGLEVRQTEAKDTQDLDASENIFKDSGYEKKSEERGFQMGHDKSHEKKDITSRFPVEFDRDEDFFTPVLSGQVEDNVSYDSGSQSQGSMDAGSASSSTETVATAQSAESSSPESQVDITSMFNFKNLKN